jgi:hypothetical protein
MRRRRLIALLVSACTLMACAGLAGPATAETLQVENEAEAGPGSLGQTILDAGAGDVIEIPPGRYPLTNGDVLVAQGNELRGAGAGQTTIVPTGGGDALEDPAVTVSGVTVDEALNPDDDDGGSEIETKVQIVALVATLALLLLVLDLVRRRRLAERYALLWMSAAVALLVLAIWRDGLDVIADLMGIADPANAIFILALGVTFVLLLHFSVATSRLAEETKILAQEVARLDQELREERSNGLPEELRASPGEPSRATTADQ